MPSQCDSCGNVIKRSQTSVFCNECNKSFHAVCQSVSKDVLKLLEDGQQQRWSCHNCDPEAPRNRPDCVANEAAQQMASCSTSEDSSVLLLRELLEKISVMQNEQSELKQLFNSWNSVINDHTKTLSEQTKALEAVQCNLSKVNDGLDKLFGENFALRKRVCDLEDKLNILEQESLRNTVEIHGVPISNDDAPSAIVCKTGLALGIKLDGSDIEAAYRVGKKHSIRSKHPPLVVRFAQSSMAEEFVRSRRVKRNLSLSDLHLNIGNVNAASPIFVNEALTQTNRRLYALARDLKRNGKVKYLWVRGGRIFVRKSEGGDRISIRSESDIETLQ